MKKKIFFIIIFLFFSVMFLLVPISGDDWGNYIVGSTGIYHSIGNAIGMYFDWEGRFFSRILINVLTYHKLLWNIVNSFLITFLVYMIIKIVNPKEKKYIYILTLLIILLMNIYTFSQTITWLAGNITYFFVIPLLLLYFYLIYNDKYNDKKYFYLLIIMNILIPMFVEHTAGVLILGNILILGYKYYKNKEINKKLILFIIISIISTLSMFLSPGNRNRTNIENIDFQKLSIINKILYNIPNFIYYTFIVNIYLILLMTFSNIKLIKNNIKNKYAKLFISIYMLVIPLISTFVYLISNFKDVNGLYIFINTNNKFIILYYISYALLLLYLYFKENDIKLLFFYIIGISANLAMLISPTWGYRTSLFTYISLTIPSLIVISKYYKDNKFLDYLLLIVCSFVVIFYLVLDINTYICQKDVEKNINEAIKENKEIVEIPSFPNYVNCNINPMNEYHMLRFKEYYKIEDKEVRFIEGRWKYLIFYKK